jgi:asparagine synthase (glutamine-hydrolysing)
MCGIAGFIDLNRRHPNERLCSLALEMSRTMRHRGPDDEGVWSDAEAGVALAMRRLAIVELSPAGHQPMRSISGRYVLVSNGEVYNSDELRNELRASDHMLAFRGQSDTEVMLAAFDHWGVRQALCRFDGMVAFALWDRQQRVLHLARDRFGEKPLYYSHTPSGVIFGSELKALRAHPEFDGELDRTAIALYLQRNCIPAPHSIYRNTAKLPPGTLLSLSERALPDAAPEQYWSAAETAMAAMARPFAGSETEAADTLEALLRDALRKRMRSDAPLGAFLSGGIDSSTVVALMRAHSRRAVKTFTIGARGQDYDEAPQATRIAKHLGTDHAQLYVTPGEALSVIPRLPAIYDEPFADASQIPTHLLARLAKQQVTVCLSGDGGDELFGGYNRHVWGHRLARVPYPLRALTGRALAMIPASICDGIFRGIKPLLPDSLRFRMPGYKLRKLGDVLQCVNTDAMYRTLCSHWSQSVLLDSQEAEHPASLEIELPPAERMMLLDTITYLPDDILVKLDRAAMAASVEPRAPFLDPRLFEFAWSLPLRMRIRHGTGKWLLRKVLYRYVPRRLVDHPKAGFGIPLDRWLAAPLRDWCEALLDEHRLRADGVFNPAPIRRMWNAYLAGQTYWTWHLWDVLIFQGWLDAQRATRPLREHACASPPA